MCSKIIKEKTMRSDECSRKISSLIPALLILAIGVVDVATDIYVPTMPLLTQYFSTSEELSALTISCYLFSFCLSGPVYGPLSDAVGRRRVLLFGLGIFTIFSGLCTTAWSIHSLIVFRFLQGLGGGVAWILGLAIVKDVYKKEESVNILATIGLVIAIAPAAAPVLGGYVATFWGWRTNFQIVGVWSLIVFLLLFYALPETLAVEKRQSFSLKAVGKNYHVLLSNFSFMAYSLISAFTFAALWAYISITPFFFIKELGLSMEEYGYYQMALLFFYMLGTLLNKHLVPLLGIKRLLGFGLIVSLWGGVCLMGGALIWSRSALAITSMMAIYCVGIGIVFSNTSTQAMEIFPHIGGASAAFLGALEMLFAALAVYLTGEFYVDTFFPVAVCVFSLALGASGIYLEILRNKRQTAC